MAFRQALKDFWFRYWLAITLTAVSLAFSIYLHLVAYSSSMQLGEDNWVKTLDVHLTWHPFADRYFQNYATLFLRELFSLPIRESFFTVQFILFMLIGPLFYRYLRELEFSRFWAHIGLIFLLTAYPLLGAHFAPTHTWDDFWSYLFLILCFTAVLRRQWGWVGLYLALGCFAREQTVLFYPVLFLAVWPYRRETNFRSIILKILVPLAVYGLFRILIYHDSDPQRFAKLAYNFSDSKRTNDTIVSFVISFGFMWVTALLAMIHLRYQKMLLERRLLFWGALITVPLTVATVLTTSFARETRLLFPPFVFIIPLAVLGVKAAVECTRANWSIGRWLGIVLSAMLAVVAAPKVGHYLFPVFDYASNSEFRRPLAGLHLGLAAVMLIWMAVIGREYFTYSSKELPLRPDSTTLHFRNLLARGRNRRIMMPNLTTIKFRPYQWISLAILLFVGLGIYLFRYSSPLKSFTETLLIRDLIWLDGWALAFYFMMIVIWLSKLSWRVKAWALVSCLAVYGTVAMALTLDGTPFSFNGYWGDQKFRQAMILKLMEFGWFTDFYYKGLPPFYPPLYYFLLGLYAKLFSVEFYKMLKVGTMYIYLLGPFLVYWLWRKIVTAYQAFLITLFTFLTCSIGKGSPLIAPHAFVATVVFVPWWLYWVERVKTVRIDWKFYLTGGLIGGAIFLTYYYPFFIGGLLLLMRVSLLRRWPYLTRLPGGFRKAALLLGAAAVVSSLYWLPMIGSILSSGNSGAQQEWHHIGSTGVGFPFMSFSVVGLLTLAGIYYALRRPTTRLNRSLLLLVGTTVFYYLIGAILGAVDRPINLIKANEFLIFVAGPFIGLAVAGLMRCGKLRAKGKFAVTVLVSVFVLVFLNEINGFANHDMVRTARTAQIASWVDESKIIAQYPGRVFLTGNEELYAFYPVYAFIAVNEHYSHPASRFIQRYNLLNLLQGVRDPFLYHLALRYNKFDAVDFFMPRDKDGAFDIVLALSNYPDRHDIKTLRFPYAIVADTGLFDKVGNFPLYRVKDADGADAVPADPGSVMEAETPLSALARLRMVRYDLNDEGQRRLDRHLALNWDGWRDIRAVAETHDFVDTISLLGGYTISTKDSLRFVFAFQPTGPIEKSYRIFFHVKMPDGRFLNYDFQPKLRTDRWIEDDIIICERTIPLIGREFEYFIGFFEEDRQLGKPYKDTFRQGL